MKNNINWMLYSLDREYENTTMYYIVYLHFDLTNYKYFNIQRLKCRILRLDIAYLEMYLILPQ